MLPAESLMKFKTFDLLPRKRWTVCRNTLFAEKWLESNRRPNYSRDFSLEIFTAEVAALRASVYRDCKSNDDLSCSTVLNASFFARIASLTSWFYQGVLFLLSHASLSRFRQQLSAADLNSNHTFSMPSDTSGRCLNLDDVLNANRLLTSLSSNASHLIRQVTNDL